MVESAEECIDVQAEGRRMGKSAADMGERQGWMSARRLQVCAFSSDSRVWMQCR